MLKTRKRQREPIPGYRLIEPLGRGGFGEVWKCEAPGGLYKAIKFVASERNALHGEGAPAAEELKSIQHIKSIRHPFLLSMERVELIDEELVIVMELADKSLMDVLKECESAGTPGIPRAELLGYLEEAADVLDLMNLRHGLQHLDIKPGNLFLVSNHVKVADFGLVRSLSDRGGEGALLSGGMTALYAAPEMFANSLSSSCDQYSLAIVYQELLTGARPFNGKNLRQLMLQHSTAEPNLKELPEGDRTAVARALSKDPKQRFPTCMAFIEALQAADKAATDAGTSAGDGPGRNGKLSERGPAQARYLPDYQFHECLGRTPVSEVWAAASPEGKPRLVKVLFGGGAGTAFDADSITRLQALHHPALPELRIVPGGPGCLLIDTDLIAENLRDRFQEYRNRGERGILRRQLLDWLRAAAESLDELARLHGLQHLGLNPRSFLFEGESVRIADFGLLPLVWRPAGQLQGQLQARYTAPELFEPQVGPACDSYSLAIVFQEMLTGTTPWRGRRSGLPNLEPLSAEDRGVLARALDIDPAQRFPTCMELVSALEGGRSSAEESEGERSGQAGASALVAELIVEAKGALPSCEVERWAAAPSGGVLQGRFPARLIANNPRASFETFRRQWNAQIVRESDNSLAFQVALPGRFWQRWLGGAPGVLVEIRWSRPRPASTTLPEVTVRVRGADKKTKPDDALIKEVGPLLLESLRSQLEAYPERRNQERVPWPHPVRAAFLLAEDTLGETIEGRGKDISLGGMGLYLPRAPAGSQIHIELTTPARGEPVVLSGHCVRVQRCSDGWFETGVLF
jgi:serine/threonine protein kinase